MQKLNIYISARSKTPNSIQEKITWSDLHIKFCPILELETLLEKDLSKLLFMKKNSPHGSQDAHQVISSKMYKCKIVTILYNGISHYYTKLNVFVSSTFIDLKDYRSEIINSIRRLSLNDISMENFGARDERPLIECQKLITKSDIFVGIYAHRYGFIPQNQSRSITELEYNHAITNQKPCFLYIVDENHP